MTSTQTTVLDVAMTVHAPGGASAYTASWPGQAVQAGVALSLSEPIVVDATDPVGNYTVEVSVSRSGGKQLADNAQVAGFAVGAGSAPDAGPGTPPTYNADGVALTAFTVKTSGGTVTAAYTLATNRAVTFQQTAVATRDAAGANLDFGHRTFTLSGSQSFTDSASLAARSYTSFIAYTLDGSTWTNLAPTRAYTVGGTPAPSPDAGAPPPPPPTTGVTPPPAPGTWKLAFNDDFNGTSYDPAKWSEQSSAEGTWATATCATSSSSGTRAPTALCPAAC